MLTRREGPFVAMEIVVLRLFGCCLLVPGPGEFVSWPMKIEVNGGLRPRTAGVLGSEVGELDSNSSGSSWGDDVNSSIRKGDEDMIQRKVRREPLEECRRLRYQPSRCRRRYPLRAGYQG